VFDAVQQQVSQSGALMPARYSGANHPAVITA
jgi:hypothetical protein